MTAYYAPNTETYNDDISEPPEPWAPRRTDRDAGSSACASPWSVVMKLVVEPLREIVRTRLQPRAEVDLARMPDELDELAAKCSLRAGG